MLLRHCCFYIALFIYSSLLRQGKDSSTRIIVSATHTFPSFERPSFYRDPFSFQRCYHRSYRYTKVPYSFIQQDPRLHRRTTVNSLRHVCCFAKNSFLRRELLQPVGTAIGVLRVQQRLESTMAAAATTIPNDMEILNAQIVHQCRILCIADKDDMNNMILYKSQGADNDECMVKHITSNLTNEEELQALIETIKEKQINTIFISDSSAKTILAYILPRLSVDHNHTVDPNVPPQSHPIAWIHSRSAGIDSYLSPELVEWYQQGTVKVHATTTLTPTSYNTVQMTNARGMFSSTLAEYSIGACTYFAKDFNRLKRNQQKRSWEKYSVLELRGSTMGIIGYGDIGRATARLAKAHGMKVLALVRQSRSSNHDEFADELIVNDVTNNDGMNRIFSESDYVLCALPLTESTNRCIGAKQFTLCKPNCVFINVGRGPIVDEDALIMALQTKRLKGAALDVFATEPLPTSSPLWDLENVLMSPHNMDQTDTFLLESTTFFVEQQIPRFMRVLPLLNHVDPTLGY